jgi:hypothetical protein
MMYDPKYRNEALLTELLRNNTLDQLLFAFDPANFRQTPEPMPLYNPNQTGQGGPQGGGGAGGGSYLDQLLAGTQQAPAAAPAAAAAPLMQILEEPKKRKIMMDGGGRIDRSGYGGLGMSGY